MPTRDYGSSGGREPTGGISPSRGLEGLAERRRAQGNPEAGGGGLGRGLLRGTLDVLNASAYGVGNLASGNIEAPVRSGLAGALAFLPGGDEALSLLPGNRKFRRTFVSDTATGRFLQRVSPLPDFIDSLAIDIATDPLTYATFGVGPAIRTAVGGATRGLARSGGRFRASQRLRNQRLSRAERNLIEIREASNLLHKINVSRQGRGGRGLESPADAVSRTPTYDQLVANWTRRAQEIRRIDPAAPRQVRQGATPAEVAAARAESSEILEQAEDILRTALREGEPVEKSLARMDALLAQATRGAGTTVKIGIRPVLGFGKPIWLMEGPTRLARGLQAGSAIDKLAEPLARTLREAFGSSGGADAAVVDVVQAGRRRKETAVNRSRRDLSQLAKEVSVAAGRSGISARQANREIIRWLDDPTQPLTPGLEDVAEQAAAYNRLQRAQMIQSGFSDEEIPFLVGLAFKDRKGAARYAEWRKSTTGAEDAPGPQGHFVNTNESQIAQAQPAFFRNRDEFEEFLEGTLKLKDGAENNVARLLFKRSEAFAEAANRKAVEEAIAFAYGRVIPLETLAYPATRDVIEAVPESVFKSADNILDDAIEGGDLPMGVGIDSPEAAVVHRKLLNGHGEAITSLRSADVPPEIASEYDQAIRALDQVGKSRDEMASLGRFAANLVQAWKSLALLSPGFHVRNQLDDGFRAWVGGARNPKTYMEALAVLSERVPKIRRGRLIWEPRQMDTQTFKLGEHEFTRRELINLMEDLGVIRTGFAGAEVGEFMPFGRRFPIETPGRGKVATASRELGQAREDAIRAFTFMENVKQGASFDDAARITRDYLFDYGDVGVAVGHLRRYWMPFVTFTSKALPNAFRMMAMRPGLFASMEKVFDALEAGSEVGPDDLPDYARSNLILPDVVSEQFGPLLGAEPGQPLTVPLQQAFTPGVLDTIPLRSFTSFEPNRAALESEIVGNLIGPLFATPTQVTLRRNAFLGFPLREGATRPSPFGLGAIPAEADLAARGFFPPYGRAAQIFPESTTPSPRGTAGFVGLPARPTRLDTESQQQGGDIQELLDRLRERGGG